MMIETILVRDMGTPRRVSTQLVTLEIDGVQVSVPAGTSVMRAAAESQINIPRLCASDSLEPFGSCRLCLVEIEGRRGYPASCTTEVAAGMQVRTQSPELRRLRTDVLELYVSEHPLDCQGCPADQHCELQTQAADHGVKDSRYTAVRAPRAPRGTDSSNPYFSFNPELCIVCSRCVRACEEVQGTYALTVSGRGFSSQIAASQNETFLESECVSCGACVESCPTAALSEKTLIQPHPAEHAVTTTCAYCGVGCSLKAEMRGTQIVRMVPDRDGKANHGHACIKGRFAYGYAVHPDRITKPMIRAKIT